MMPDEAQPNKDFHIRVLSDGSFVLTAGQDDYGYETVDELLAALKDELGEPQGESEETDKKKKVKQMMEGNEDEEI